MADSNLTRGKCKNVLLLPAGLTPEKEAEACAVNWAVLSGACDRCRRGETPGGAAQDAMPKAPSPPQKKKGEGRKEHDEASQAI